MKMNICKLNRAYELLKGHWFKVKFTFFLFHLAIDKCVPNLCHANATCQTSGDSFVCVCKKGYVAGKGTLGKMKLNSLRGL